MTLPIEDEDEVAIDGALRAAERRWTQEPTAEHESAYVAAALRAGTLSPTRVALAAFLGHEVSVGLARVPSAQAGVWSWARELEPFGPLAGVRIALAAGVELLPALAAWRPEERAPATIPGAAWRVIECPCAAHLAELAAAHLALRAMQVPARVPDAVGFALAALDALATAVRLLARALAGQVSPTAAAEVAGEGARAVADAVERATRSLAAGRETTSADARALLAPAIVPWSLGRGDPLLARLGPVDRLTGGFPPEATLEARVDPRGLVLRPVKTTLDRPTTDELEQRLAQTTGLVVLDANPVQWATYEVIADLCAAARRFELRGGHLRVARPLSGNGVPMAGLGPCGDLRGYESAEDALEDRPSPYWRAPSKRRTYTVTWSDGVTPPTPPATGRGSRRPPPPPEGFGRLTLTGRVDGAVAVRELLDAVETIRQVDPERLLLDASKLVALSDTALVFIKRLWSERSGRGRALHAIVPARHVTNSLDQTFNHHYPPRGNFPLFTSEEAATEVWRRRS